MILGQFPDIRSTQGTSQTCKCKKELKNLNKKEKGGEEATQGQNPSDLLKCNHLTLARLISIWWQLGTKNIKVTLDNTHLSEELIKC